ncbi:MAG: helix-turn-helix domain-containing protein, partial [Clostridia bacterium]
NVPHAFSFDPLADESFQTYDLLFTPNFFNISGMGNNEFYSLASSYLFSPIFEEYSSQDIFQNLIKTNSKEFHTLFKNIHTEYTKREKGFQNIIRAYLIELITKIFREIDKQQPLFTQSHQELVEKAIDHMRENYKSHISLDDIVSGMFLSKNYFRQIFKKTTGTSISSYIQDLRINEACRLLETTVDSSAEIAAKCGFNDIKFFYQTFKKAVGMTPAEYRREKLMKE